MNDPKHAAPNGAFGLLTNDSYRPAAPTELISVVCLQSSVLSPQPSALCPPISNVVTL
jgi:hypothetical protein